MRFFDAARGASDGDALALGPTPATDAGSASGLSDEAVTAVGRPAMGARWGDSAGALDAQPTADASTIASRRRAIPSTLVSRKLSVDVFDRHLREPSPARVNGQACVEPVAVRGRLDEPGMARVVTDGTPQA